MVFSSLSARSENQKTKTSPQACEVPRRQVVWALARRERGGGSAHLSRSDMPGERYKSMVDGVNFDLPVILLPIEFLQSPEDDHAQSLVLMSAAGLVANLTNPPLYGTETGGTAATATVDVQHEVEWIQVSYSVPSLRIVTY